jgi:hypothetical protein
MTEARTSTVVRYPEERGGEAGTGLARGGGWPSTLPAEFDGNDV